MGMQPVENGKIRPAATRRAPLENNGGHQVRTLGLVAGHQHGFGGNIRGWSSRPRLLLVPRGNQRGTALWDHAGSGHERGILRDERERGLQNGGGRTPILFQGHHPSLGKITLEQAKGGARCSPETVNGLVGIADGEEVALVSGEHLEDLHLREVCVLKFVHQDEAGLLAFLAEYRRVLEQMEGAGDHVAEAAQVFFPQHALDGGENLRDLAASPQPFLFPQGMVRLAHAGDAQLAALQALDILRVPLRAHQFVVAAAREVEQIGEKLGDVGGAHKIVQAQFANAFAQIDPKVLVVEHPERGPVAGQQFVRIVVEGARPQAGNIHAAQFAAHALAHFLGCVFGVGQRQDLFGLGVAFPHQTGNALGQDRRLSRPRPGHHQHGTIHMFDGGALAFVRFEPRQDS